MFYHDGLSKAERVDLERAAEVENLDKEIAVPSVFLFRLATFWLPILPGWLALTALERSDQL